MTFHQMEIDILQTAWNVHCLALALCNPKTKQLPQDFVISYDVPVFLDCRTFIVAKRMRQIRNVSVNKSH